MKLYPKNRIIKHTFKYNKHSDCPRSLSKSVSQDQNPPENFVTGSRSHKGTGKAGENLLKQSLKKNHNLIQKEASSTHYQRQDRPQAPARNVPFNRLDFGSFDAQQQDIFNGGYAPRRKHHRLPIDKFNDRPQITPRQIPGTGTVLGMDGRVGSNQLEKRSQSVHNLEKTLAEDSHGDSNPSLFMRNNSKHFDESQEDADAYGASGSGTQLRRGTSRFYEKNMTSDSSCSLTQEERVSAPKKARPDPTEAKTTVAFRDPGKLKEFVNNLIED